MGKDNEIALDVACCTVRNPDGIFQSYMFFFWPSLFRLPRCDRMRNPDCVITLLYGVGCRDRFAIPVPVVLPPFLLPGLRESAKIS